MKKKLLNLTQGFAVLCVLLVSFQGLRAQQFAVVGNGTTFNTTTSYPAPYGNYWYGARHQFFVPASELIASGMTAANIQGLGFNVGTSNGTSHLGFSVIVYTTTLANPLATAYHLTGQVASSLPSNYTPSTGWNMHALTPFNWWGTENLVIEVCFNNTSFTSNALTMWTTTLTGATFSRWRNADAAGQCTMVSTSSSTNTRPNIRFEYIPLPPCVGVPNSNSVVSPTYAICPGESIGLAMATPFYSTGLTYQWTTATLSSVGPFVPVSSGGNESTYTTPTLTSTTWYQVEITCANQGSTTSATGTVIVGGPTSSTVPYYETFELVGKADRLPNCSWLAPNIGNTFRTYMTSNTGNRIPLSGTKFAAFTAPTTTNYVYTNGIQMEPGITYSAALFFATEYSGANNWSDLSIMLGTAQTPGTMTNIVSAAPAISGAYKLLSNTFTVGTSGLYYLGIRATGLAGNAQYLMIDDISVTIPCTPQSGNNPTVTAIANANTVCANQPVMLTANGASTYTWSTSQNAGVISPTVTNLGTNTFVVAGTNALTSCTASGMVLVEVIASPVVNVNAVPPIVCAGEKVVITATGANSYLWSTGGTGPMIVHQPNINTTYQVIGTGANGCSSSISVPVAVNKLPTVTASASRQIICYGEGLILNGGGANSYMWTAVNSGVVLSGSMIATMPGVTDSYIVTGTDLNGCKGTAMVAVVVETCSGISENAEQLTFNVYPNPASDMVTVEFEASAPRTIQVFDVNGRLVSNEESDDLKHSISFKEFTAGLYFIRVSDTNGERFSKIIKE